VHHFAVTLSITTNGNAPRLLVQVHGFPQCGVEKEGGTEHGGVLGMEVTVPKL
jgi:hypothetical protein